MKKIILGIVLLFSVVGCSKSADVAVKVEEPKANIEEKKVEQPVKVETEKAEVLPSFSKEDIDNYGLRAVFVEAKKIYKNGDKEYYFEPFGISFVVPAKYSQYYLLDTMSEMEVYQSIDFLTKEDFANPPVVDAADFGVSIFRMNKQEYKDFKKNISAEGITEEKMLKIGGEDFKRYTYDSFGNAKIYNYVFQDVSYFYVFHAPDSKKDFIEAIIKSVKFGNNL